MLNSGLAAYLPLDRRYALACGQTLPDRSVGTALFADLSGFTPLTEALTQAFGPRRGAEELTHCLDRVYDALIAEVERYGGSVVNFAGDAITCWFDAQHMPQQVARRAALCALAMQEAMTPFGAIPLQEQRTVTLALKVAVASGPARRFVVGDPALQLLDTLAGATIARLATAEHLAQKGEVLLDVATATMLGEAATLNEWRMDESTGERFAVLGPLDLPATPAPWPPLPRILHEEELRPWLLPAVYARERGGQGQFLTEFRPVVALFLRFEGLDYDYDAQAGAKLDALLRRVQGIVAHYEGTLIQLTIGDKGSYLYAAFGIPQVHEDDPQRAAQAALELRRLPTELPFLQTIQIGISRGTMRTGGYGGTTRRTYGALGDEVNLAARLMQAAAPGETLVSGRVEAVLAQDFTLHTRPPLAVKGRREPLPIFSLQGNILRRVIRLQEPTYGLPMFGRQAELALVAEKMELAIQGKGQIVGLVGEAGMGKSRLSAEVIRLARRRGLVGYGGACQSYGTNTPYLVWKPICQALFDVDPTLPLPRQLHHLEEEMAWRAPRRLDALPLLAPLLDLPLPENAFTRSLEPKERKGALEALLVECLRASVEQAREQKAALLLVLEDMHWLDPASHDLLETLARVSEEWPLLILLAYRLPDFQRLQGPRIEGLSHFTRIALSDLPPEELEKLIRAKLSQHHIELGGPLPTTLLEQLMARAQGNPFYVEELLNYLNDRGVNPYEPEALIRLEWPASLQQLILSRIDQLSERQKVALKAASIIGRLFRFTWLHGYYPALGEPQRLRTDLDELARLGLTPMDTPEPELSYLFKHIVTQEVTYEGLAYATRAKLHEQLARYLEEHAPGAEVLDLLAYHYGRSENTSKQREYLRLAGEAAQAAYTNEAALEYYRRLLPLLAVPGEQIEVRLKLGCVLELVGQWDAAECHYRETLALAEQYNEVIPVATCQEALGRMMKRQGEYHAAVSWLDQARLNWGQLGEHSGVSRALRELGHTLWDLGEYPEAGRYLTEGLTIARALGDKLGMAEALRWLGTLTTSQGYPGAAHPYLEESLALFREAGNKSGVVWSLNDLGSSLRNHGNYAAARPLHEEQLLIAQEIGDKSGVAYALANLGFVAYFQGEYQPARSRLEEALLMARQMRAKRAIAERLLCLGHVALEQGDYLTARAHYEEALDLFHKTGFKGGLAFWPRGLGYLKAIQGNYAGARTHLEA
ncbi:MAG: tetratricopeptide repeat protein, partial [Ardenticatenales bacterium]|nr:tetratricopeptide repeat protein [Ardenticatenales bacterium]